jgi:hypothetical protein
LRSQWLWPGYNRPPFWAYTFNETKTRPIPAGSGWLDYLVVQLGESPGTAPVGYSLVINQFIATGQVSPIVSGLRYRFLLKGTRLRSEEFDITNDIERHVDHGAARPWPAMQRRTFIQVGNQQLLVLQVNNTGGATTKAFASLAGWYYPNLGDMPRGSQEAGSQQDQDRFNG